MHFYQISQSPSRTSKNKIMWKTFNENIVSPSGERLLYPCVTYFYRSIKESLKLLIAREDFENDCEKWRSLVDMNGIMSNVYHGQI